MVVVVAGAGIRVLLIEQNPELRAMITRNLNTVGCWIEALPEASDPAAFAETIQPQVIVIRLQPAIQHDQQVVEALLKNPRTSAIPVVVICTLVGEARALATFPNVSEILVAPFRLEALRDAVVRSSRAGER